MKSGILKHALGVVTGIAKSPILLLAQDGKLTFGSSNDFSTIVVEGSTDFEDFRVVLTPEHARQIAKVIKPSQDISLFVDNDNLVVKQGKAKMTFATLAEESVSLKLLMYHYKEDFAVEFNSADFRAAISRVSFFAGGIVADARTDGMHVTVNGDVAELMTTNSFSLAVTRFPATSLDDSFSKTVIFSKSIFFLEKAFGEKVSFGKSPKHIFLKGEDDDLVYKVTFPVVDKQPFPYRDLISGIESSVDAQTFIVDKTELADVSNSSLYFTDTQVKNKVSMSFSDDGLAFQSENDRGHIEHEVPLVSCSGSGTMSISLDFLSKSTGAFKDEIKARVALGRLLLTQDDVEVIIPSIKS